MTLDIKSNRSSKKYSYKIIALRIFWSLGELFFKYSPRIAFSWRRIILTIFGAKIGSKVNVYNSASIYMPWNLEISDWSSIGEHAKIYNIDIIKIGERVTISQGAHLCTGTHDYEQRDVPLVTKPIIIEDNAWICADSFIGPGVTLEEGCIVGARAVVMKNVKSNSIMAGNPATEIKKRVLKSK